MSILYLSNTTKKVRGNVQNSNAKELYIVSQATFETIKESSISSFRNLRFILETTHIDLESKNFTYSDVFKPFSDVLNPYSGVFLKNFLTYRFMESYSGVFNPYSDVLQTYSGVFIQFMETESLKLDFQLNFFPL